jgi:hypothetical protein
MGQEIQASDETGIHELRKLLPGRSSIRPHGDGYEVIVFPSNLDDSLTFFVSFPKAHMDKVESRAAATEPEKS